MKIIKACAFLAILLLTASVISVSAQVYMERAVQDLEKGSAQEQKEKNLKDIRQRPARESLEPSSPFTASNYVFSTATNASLSDMSSGTTQLLGANIDDTASPLTNIGFDFYFQGVRYAQFGVNDNGVLRLGAAAQAGSPYQPLAQASLPIITAYGADQRTHAGDGKVHYKVTGAAGSRILIIEWLNTQSNFNSGGTADLTYQVRLYETTGVIEFVYGSMTMSTAGAADANSQDPNIGFSSSNIAGTVGSVTAAQSGTPAPTFDGASATAVGNLYLVGPIAALSSAAQGSRRIFSFAPPTPTAPTGLSFTGVTGIGMTLNWTDSPNETIYGIYRSTDGVNYAFDGTAAQNATAYVASSLAPSTTYFWRVFAASEGAFSAALAGSQATAPPGAISSTGAGGNWSAPATWVGGVVPGSADNVTITAGSIVTIDTAAVALNVTVSGQGILLYEPTTARSLTVGQDVNINFGAPDGQFKSAATGTVTTHSLNIGGNLVNDGILDFSTNADTAGVVINFTGAGNATYSGVGPTNDIRTINVNKGTSSASILELTATNFTVRGVTTDTVAGGWLVQTNGTMKISGTFAGASRVFSAAAYTIPTTAGIWLNNPNYVVAAQAGNAVNNGLFRISNGTFNQGTVAADSFRGGTGAIFTIEGGTVNCAGQFSPQSAVVYNQSGGILNVGLVGNSQSNFGTFELFSGASTFTMSAGAINIVQASTGTTQIDYQNLAVSSVTGGTVKVGTSATVTKFTFNIRGNLPNLVIDNTTNNKTATATGQVNLLGSTTINVGTTFTINGQICLVLGPTFTNNGTLTGTAVSTRFYFLGGSGPTIYAGSGVVTAPLTSFEVDNVAGVAINPAVNPLVTARFNNFSGGLTGSGKLTIGNGGATTAVVQLGVAGVTQTISGFDVPPVFNPGTGGVILLYAPELTGRTTGPEVPPSRTLTTLGITNPNNITISGGDITVNGTTAGALALGSAHVITGVNTLFFNSSLGTVTRSTGYVDGNFRKRFAAVGSQSYEVGTANGYSPATVNATAGTFPADLSVAAVQQRDPNGAAPADSINRYWDLNLTSGALTTDLTFQYLVGDLPAGSNEAGYTAIKDNGTIFKFPVNCPTPTAGQACVNAGTHSIAVSGVSSFSKWFAGLANGPTAASVSVGGRVMTADGRGLRNARVVLTDQNGVSRVVMTGTSGRYQFDDVKTDATYQLRVVSKRYTFGTKVLVVNDTLTDIDFVAGQ